MAKIKQIFKVEKLNQQQEDTIKLLLHLIKLNNKHTTSVIENIITVNKRPMGHITLLRKQFNSTHDYHNVNLEKKNSLFT